MQQNHPPIQLPITMMGDRATNSAQVIGREKKRQQRMKEAAKEETRKADNCSWGICLSSIAAQCIHYYITHYTSKQGLTMKVFQMINQHH